MDAMGATPSDLARRMNRAFLYGDLDGLEAMVHEKAEIASYLAPGRVLRGCDAVMDALRRAMNESVYNIVVDSTRDLSHTVAMGTGSVRYAKDDNTIAMTQAAWLWKWEDGRLLRARHYPSVDVALSDYDPDIDGFEAG